MAPFWSIAEGQAHSVNGTASGLRVFVASSILERAGFSRFWPDPFAPGARAAYAAPMLERPIRLLIFDLDGTLIDSAPDIVSAVHSLTRSRGLPDLPDAQVRTAIGEGLRALIHSVFPVAKTDPEYSLELEADFERHYEAHLLEKTRVFPGVESFLNVWPGAISIVTNKQERFARASLAGVGLDTFDWIRIFGADSLPEKKPSPLPLLETMRAAGVPPEQTLMIGDGIPDIVAARNAGVRSIAVEFGYADVAKLVALGASATVSGFDKLLPLIAGMTSPQPRANVLR